MKKVLLAVGIVVIFAGYAIYQHNQSANKNNLLTVDTNVNQSPASDTPPLSTNTPITSTPPPSPAPNPTPTPTPTPKGQFKDGEYTGSVADAFYGNIQVKAVVQGGKLADVQFLQYPSDRGESIQISNRMMPILKSEAIKAQSANVDVVSGATQDSEAFVKTLQSALDQAKI